MGRGQWLEDHCEKGSDWTVNRREPEALVTKAVTDWFWGIGRWPGSHCPRCRYQIARHHGAHKGKHMPLGAHEVIQRPLGAHEGILRPVGAREEINRPLEHSTT